jgi:hypothetical protein
MTHVVLLGVSLAPGTFRSHGVDVSSFRQLADAPKCTANNLNNI